MITEWKDKKVAVIGAGVEGLSSALWLDKQGANVTMLDKNEDTGIGQRAEGIEFKTGKDYLKGLDSYDVIVRSPGVKRSLPEILDAEEQGKIITSQTQIFFDLSPSPIIGVTGTKGKGTTSALIYEMLKTEGLDVYLGGNIGTPPLNFLDKLTLESWVVLELSSFQLEDLSFPRRQESRDPRVKPEDDIENRAIMGKPHIAVILMITPEHLGIDSVGTANYHESMEEYVSAKRNIVRNQTDKDYVIINRDYPASLESDVYAQGKMYQVSREREAAGDGCFTRQGRVIIRKDGKEEDVIEVSEILLPGKHNYENVCAASMAADLAGVSLGSIASAIRQFKGLPHRLDLVKEVKGVRYYDDSFSTTPETAIAAIEAFEDPEILILGGSHKDSDFTELGKVISERQNIKAIIGIGVEWERVKMHLQMANSKWQIVENCKSMEEVVQKAAEIAEPGDVVLLSPACASFGMFRDYKERGELFKAEIKRL